MRLDEAPRRDKPRGEPSDLWSGMSAAGSSDAAWRTGGAGVFSAVRLALLRVSHTRWLLLVVAIGILVADVLISTVPLYNTIVPNMQLQNAMARSDTLQRNMQVVMSTSIVNRARSEGISHAVQSLADSYLAPFSAPHPTVYLNSSLLSLDQAGAHKFGGLNNTAQAHLQGFDFAALRPYLHILQGVPPQTPSAADVGQPIQVMVTREMADDWHLSVGDPVMLSALTRQVFSGGDPVRTDVKGTVTAIFEPINAQDPFWNDLTFDNPSASNASASYVPPIYPILTTTDSFFSALAHDQPENGVSMTQTWVYYADLNRITTDNMADVANGVIAFRSQVAVQIQDTPSPSSGNGPRYNFTRDSVLMLGHLDQIIQGAQKQLSLILLPLYVIAAQVVGVALLFVAAMAALLIEQQSQQIATLKSRGISGIQLLGIFTTQSALLGLVAAVASPFLAVALALLVIRLFLPEAISASGGGSVSDGASLISYITRVATPSLVILPALVGAALAIAVVTISALRTARLDVLAFRREMARPSRHPFWRRAYLDVALALLCLVGYLDLSLFGGTNARLELGNQANSPLLLLTPALLLLAGGLLLLRVVPLAARLGSRFASRGRGLTALLAFAQIERSPTRYARMTLLLVLAVGLGLFALTFDASLTRNVQDRTAYAAGADFRLMTTLPIAVNNTDSYLAQLRKLPSVVAATPLLRTVGRTSLDLGGQPAEVLGVDAPTFAGAINPHAWRDDYASQPLAALMRQLTPSSVADPATIGTGAHPLRALVSATFAQQLHLRVGDRIQLGLPDIESDAPTFLVSAIIQEFPSLYPTRAPGGFVVADLDDLDATIAARAVSGTLIGPNEFWVRSSPGASATTRQALDRGHFNLSLNTVDDYQQDLRQAEDNPVTGGMRGLLLIGAVTAALLAVLGSLAQAVMSARQRTTQFAIFRTLGMANRQLTGLLLSEQMVVYLFGLVGGTLLGLVLTTATTPYLTFSDTAIDLAAVGVPGYVLAANWSAIGVFYGALVVAFALALIIAARYAATIGLGKALRLGED
ncbi:MAG TPA: FtsX-like permease family protein [Ktedonobacterales bacterium]|jgi:putative ABC transport system permease protein